MSEPQERAALPDSHPMGAYDVDALLIELGDDRGGEAADTAVCQTLEEVYGVGSRFLVVQEFGAFLDTRGITATEFLHKEEPQRSFLDWPGRAAVLERLARRQSRPGVRTPAMRLEELAALEREVLAHTQERSHRGSSLSIDARMFAATVPKTMAKTPGFAGRFALDAWVTAWLGECGGIEARLSRLLDLDSAELSADGLAILGQFMGEMSASAGVCGALFGWAGGPRAVMEALAMVWRGETIPQPDAPAILARLSAFVATRDDGTVRQGLAISIQRLLASDERLAGGAGPEARGPLALRNELAEIGRLSAGLAAGGDGDDGALVGGARTAELLDRRVTRLLDGPRLEATLNGRSHYARVLDLLELAGAATGEVGRRMVLAAVQRHLDTRDLTQRLFETARTPRARIKVLADLQRRVQQAPLPEPLRDRYARMFDEMQHTFLRANRILGRIARDRSPTVGEVMEFAALLAENAFTEGKCAALARSHIGHHVRSTAFLRAYLSKGQEEAGPRAERFQRFFTVLDKAGIALRSMGGLRILLADDESAARGYVEMILRDLGVTSIVTAEDGRQALDRFEGRENDFDLVICDWKMPGMSGLAFLKHVRTARPDLPFLMVTALATLIAVEEALAHDVTAYIAKPFTPDQLEEKVLVLVNRP